MATSRSLPELSDEDYRQLAELRYELRQFLSWSEDQAKLAGLTPAQHQLLLAIRGSDDPRGPSVGDIADVLLIRHHSAVGLVDRAQEAGLVERERDHEPPSTVRLHLTDAGAKKLRTLSKLHLRELVQLAPTMQTLWAKVAAGDRPTPLPRH